LGARKPQTLKKGYDEKWMSFYLLDRKAQNGMFWKKKIKITNVDDDQGWKGKGLYSEAALFL